MKNLRLNKSTLFKPIHLLSIFLILVLVCSGLGQRRKRIEISALMQPSSEANLYFQTEGKFGGGVVPRGSAQFVDPQNNVVAARELQLVVLDKAKFRNRRADYNAVGIGWKDHVYELGAPDDLIYPLMKFIQRNKFIIYTVPVAGFNRNFFTDNALRAFRRVEPLGMGYVAKEFLGTQYAELLEWTDFAETVPMSRNLQQQILSHIKTGPGVFTGDGSYVNADFHVNYKVFLEIEGGKRVVNVAGLPLRYFWFASKTGGGVKVDKLEVFRYPSEPLSQQDRSVMLFQTTAILRQFSKTNPKEFNRFLSEVEGLVRR